MEKMTQALVAMLISGTFMVVLHYIPWQQLGNLADKYPHVIVRYISGVLAFLLPFTVLLIVWQEYIILATIWALIVFSGSMVMVLHLVDAFLNEKSQATIGRIMKTTRDSLLEDAHETRIDG
jgi:Na+/phosphate symporter